MATHSSTLAWKIPWVEEPGRQQSMRSLGVGHDWVTSLSLFISCIGEGNGNPLQCSCLESPRDGGAWWAAVSVVAHSRTRLKWLSISSSSSKDNYSLNLSAHCQGLDYIESHLRKYRQSSFTLFCWYPLYKYFVLCRYFSFEAFRISTHYKSWHLSEGSNLIMRFVIIRFNHEIWHC